MNGQGEVIRSGGRVLKNVTGLDLSIPQAAYRRLRPLAVLADHAEGAARRRRQSAPLCWRGSMRRGRSRRCPRRSARLTAFRSFLAAAGGGARRSWPVWGQRDLGAWISPQASSTRTGPLRADLAGIGDAEILDDATSRAVWRAVRDARPFGGGSGGARSGSWCALRPAPTWRARLGRSARHSFNWRRLGADRRAGPKIRARGRYVGGPTPRRGVVRCCARRDEFLRAGLDVVRRAASWRESRAA